MDCVFCRIARHETPAFIVHEDDDFLAFLDIFPYGPGHTLVIPKTHYPRVWDVPDLGRYIEFTRKMALHLTQAMATETSYSFIFGEQVPHAHIHLLPTLTESQVRLGQAFKSIRQPKLDPAAAEALLEKLKLSST